MKKKDNNINTRSGLRGRRDLILYNINKLILKTSYNPENEIKYPDNSDNSSNTYDYILKLFFFRSYSAYCFRIPEMVFVGTRRRRFDQVSADLFRVNR